MRYTGLQQTTHKQTRPQLQTPILEPYTPALIDTKTPLLEVMQACEELKRRGISYHPETMRRYCRSGVWLEHRHWIKGFGRYLINVEAVHKSLINQ